MADDTTKTSKKVFRSPNHPAFDLKQAIEKIGTIYQKEKRSATTPDVIVKHLGYSQTNGPGGRALSGLRQFGLLDESGGHLKISDLGFDILHCPGNSYERQQALKKAALAPTLYKELRQQYPDGSASDETLKSNLLKRAFNPAVIDNVIDDYRSTMTLAGLNDVSYTDPAEENKMPATAVISSEKQPASAVETQPGGKSYAFSFAGEGRAELRITGAYSTEDLDDLQTYLEVTMRSLKRSKERGA